MNQKEKAFYRVYIISYKFDGLSLNHIVKARRVHSDLQ